MSLLSLMSPTMPCPADREHDRAPAACTRASAWRLVGRAHSRCRCRHHNLIGIRPRMGSCALSRSQSCCQAPPALRPWPSHARDQWPSPWRHWWESRHDIVRAAPRDASLAATAAAACRQSQSRAVIANIILLYLSHSGARAGVCQLSCRAKGARAFDAR
jgi:hypothetical protein